MFSCLPKCVYSAILSHKEWTSFWGAGHDGDDDDSDDDDSDDDDAVAEEAQYAGAIAKAIEWTTAEPFQVSAATQGLFTDINVKLYDVQLGHITEVVVSGETNEISSVQTYQAGPSQLTRILEVLAEVPYAAIDFAEAMNIAQIAHPDSLTHESALKMTGTALAYGLDQRAGLVTIPVEVNASTGEATDTTVNPTTPGDFNQDGIVGIDDLLEVITMWDTTNPMYDLDNSGTVNIGDLLTVVSAM